MLYGRLDRCISFWLYWPSHAQSMAFRKHRLGSHAPRELARRSNFFVRQSLEYTIKSLLYPGRTTMRLLSALLAVPLLSTVSVSPSCPRE